MSGPGDRLGCTVFLWRLERADGVTVGLTSHDRDIPHDGLLYRAAPGMLPSAVRLTDGWDADAMEVEGAFAAGAIREDELAIGRWDGAAVRLLAVEWDAPHAPARFVARGEIGEVRHAGGRWTASLRGPTARLDAQVAEATSPECRAELGDRRCRVDLAPLTRVARVTGVGEDGTVTVAFHPAQDPPELVFGRLRWLEGPGTGVAQGIAAQDGEMLRLRGEPPAPPRVGMRVELTEGCDRSLGTCAGRFGNAANFRGEPHLPGMDLLTRYPGA